jgi:hypothetical protein
MQKQGQCFPIVGRFGKPARSDPESRWDGLPNRANEIEGP